MSTVNKFDANTLTTVLDDTAVAGNGSLTTLAAGSAAITGTAIDNTPATRGDLWMDVEFTLFYGTNPVAGETVSLYLLPSYDGTNFEDGTAGATPVTVGSHFVGSVPLRAVTTVQRLALRGIPIPPTKFNLQFVNNSAAAALAAQNSGSRVKVMTMRTQSV